MNTIARNSKWGLLSQLKTLGFVPATIIDVGIQAGTPELYATFPSSVHVLVEPVVEQEPVMQKICATLPYATYILAAAAEQTGRATLQVSKNRMYSTVSDTQVVTTSSDSWDSREVDTIALDDLSSHSNMAAPVLLKIDVDGNEASVLKGAKNLLREKVEVAIVEATLFGQIDHITEIMIGQDFVIYDMIDPLYRPLDGALWQVDLVFVKRHGRFRTHSAYADEQEMARLAKGKL